MVVVGQLMACEQAHIWPAELGSWILLLNNNSRELVPTANH